MKNITYFLTVFWLFVLQSSSANNLWVDSIRLSPTVITKNDSVEIRMFTHTTSIGYQAYINTTVTPGNIWITGCYKISLATGTSYFADTFKIGKLPEGQYHINFLGYVSTDSQCTNIIDTIKTTDTIIVHAPERIDQVDENLISVYPNPASDYVNIVLRDGDSVELAVLQDVHGKELKKTNEHRLPIAELPRGLYILQVQTNKGRMAQKFWKE